jgi:hypothetical protein
MTLSETLSVSTTCERVVSRVGVVGRVHRLTPSLRGLPFGPELLSICIHYASICERYFHSIVPRSRTAQTVNLGFRRAEKAELHPNAYDALSGIGSGGQNRPQQVQLFGEGPLGILSDEAGLRQYKDIRRYV